MSRLLTRDEILKVKDLQTEVVHVPEWGGDVLVKALSAKERDELESSMMTGSGVRRSIRLDNFTAKLFAKSVCDSDGKLLFREEDVGPLGQKSAAALRRVIEVAQRLSGMTAGDVEKLTGDLKKE